MKQKQSLNRMEASVRKSPRPHQQEARDAIVAELSSVARTHAVMPCGSGKSLVGLWVMEALRADTTVVFVPSIALIGQMYQEWLANCIYPRVRWLAVCSDDTVLDDDQDEIVVHPADIGCPVSTDPSELRNLIASRDYEKLVVFCTYHSAPVLAASLPAGFRFEFGLYDEAHKTAGNRGKVFASTLTDSIFPIRKRLFMTATPRHSMIVASAGEREEQAVFSMDDTSVYGERAYQLTYQNAVALGIIVPYQVIIPVITEASITNELLARGMVMGDRSYAEARTVATWVAIRKAMQEYSVRKVVTFHESIETAKQFADQGFVCGQNDVVGPPCFHVNGVMRSAERREVLDEFAAGAAGVLTNAGCLTEGVDVPAIDMVAFLSPKRSKVSIIQAIGRALRRAPGKNYGYVLVPLFIEDAQGESVDQAIARSDFREICEVLQALKEEDDVLADMIRSGHSVCGGALGQSQTGAGYQPVVMFGAGSMKLQAGDLHAAIASRLVDITQTSWERQYTALKMFVSQYGYAAIRPTGSSKNLWNWCKKQRTAKRQGGLSPQRVELLQSISFPFDPMLDIKDARLAEFRSFVSEYGRNRVSIHDDARWQTLRQYIMTLRRRHFAGQLSTPEKEAWESAGMVWDNYEERWMNLYQELALHMSEGGNVDWDSIPQHLRKWVTRQKQAYKREELKPERVEKLIALGIALDTHHCNSYTSVAPNDNHSRGS